MIAYPFPYLPQSEQIESFEQPTTLFCETLLLSLITYVGETVKSLMAKVDRDNPATFKQLNMALKCMNWQERATVQLHAMTLKSEKQQKQQEPRLQTVRKSRTKNAQPADVDASNPQAPAPSPLPEIDMSDVMVLHPSPLSINDLPDLSSLTTLQLSIDASVKPMELTLTRLDEISVSPSPSLSSQGIHEEVANPDVHLDTAPVEPALPSTTPNPSVSDETPDNDASSQSSSNQHDDQATHHFRSDPPALAPSDLFHRPDSGSGGPAKKKPASRKVVKSKKKKDQTDQKVSQPRSIIGKKLQQINKKKARH